MGAPAGGKAAAPSPAVLRPFGRQGQSARRRRKALWNEADLYVEIWLEKDALAGVVYPVTSMYMP